MYPFVFFPTEDLKRKKCLSEEVVDEVDEVVVVEEVEAFTEVEEAEVAEDLDGVVAEVVSTDSKTTVHQTMLLVRSPSHRRVVLKFRG